MDEKLLLEQIDAFVAENRENVLRDLKTLVDINSVEGQPQPGAPFGPGPKKALEAALDIAAGMGLDAHNCEGYIGYADLPGASPTQIATITHLDVVPEGNGWTGSPFDMVRRDGYVVGRGVADDKGPAVLTLYAAKFFKQQGATLPYTLRILLGANEETGMKDVDYYLEHYPQPAFCFTPDAEFPVCYGEKGGYGGWLVSAPLHGNLIDFQGGVAHNVVPDRAYALVRADASALKDTENVKVTAEADGVARISAFGKGGHAAMPAGAARRKPARWKCCAGCTPPQTAAAWASPRRTTCSTRSPVWAASSSWKTARCAKASTSVSPPAPMPRRCAPRCRSWRRTRAAASCRTAPVFRSISTPIPRSSRRSSGRTTM